MRSNSSNILLLWDRIGDYHNARYISLSSLNKQGITLLGAFGASDNLYKWDNNEDVIMLSNKGVNQSDFLNRLIKFRSLIKKHNINTVFIPGYGRPEYLVFILLCNALGIRVYLFAESWYDGSWFKKKMKRLFLSLTVKGIFVSGNRAFNHFYKEVGLKKMPIEMGYSAIDNKHFEGISDRKNIILCVARYSSEKNLPSLINAFKKSKSYNEYKLVLVGDGPQKEILERIIGDDEQIILKNWLKYDELPAVYQSSKLFILPSRFEPWGLVVNEALSAGLPVAVSNSCGCVDELVTKETGITFNPNSEGEIIEGLNKLIELSDEEYENMSKSAIKIVGGFNLENWSNAILKLIRK